MTRIPLSLIQSVPKRVILEVAFVGVAAHLLYFAFVARVSVDTI